jgi:hypothetical protein
MRCDVHTGPRPRMSEGTGGYGRIREREERGRNVPLFGDDILHRAQQTVLGLADVKLHAGFDLLRLSRVVV